MDRRTNLKLLLGAIFSVFSLEIYANESSHDHSSKNEQIYTCPMHPQIRQPNPGRCPICGMELVLADSGASNSSADGDSKVTITPASRRLSNIKTKMVEPKTLFRKIRSIGNITFDESRLATISAYVPGRIEKLYADYTGISVKQGDHLAVVYSPKLYSAQVEYIQAVRTYSKIGNSLAGTQTQLIANARTKLSELGMSEKQIDTVIKKGKAQSRLEVFAPMGGTVIEKPSAQGLYLQEGQTMFKIADLSTVWLMIDIFPEDATQIHYGQSVEAKVRSLPGKSFEGRVAFISPVVDPIKRTVSVRVEIPNSEGLLRPGDYAESEITVPVSLSGNTKIFDKSLVGKYICPMHPQIISDKPGRCSICNMELSSAKNFGYSSDNKEQEELLSLPRNAVLRLGRNSVIYVEESEGTFTLRQVETGPTIGNEIVITKGLQEFETVAVDGVFLIDSQMQLSGKTSLIDISTHPDHR